MTTIQDVAKRAGVAPITVSRVINNSGYVGEAVRRRVQEAVDELGYVPNTLARSLRSRRTHTLALILTDITNPFFTTVARGAEDEASDAGYMLLLANTDEREAEEQRYLRMILQKRVDGVLLVPVRSGSDALGALHRLHVPVVVLDRRASDPAVDVVRCDSEGGAYELGKHLVSLGHREFATLVGPAGVSTADDRVAGFQRALAESGAPNPAPVYRGGFDLASGYEMTMRAMAAHPRPTALFAANNFLAIGALNALRDAGIRVPDDVALVGFDDLPPALVTFPFLTVAAQPAYEMGRRAVRLLLDRLEGDAPAEPREVVLPTELIVRTSCGGRVHSHSAG